MKLRICVLGTEVEPISTYVDFGEREFLVADQRGYEYLLYKMAQDFLFTSEGKILHSRLQLNKVEQSHSFYFFLLFYALFVLQVMRKIRISFLVLHVLLSICCRDSLTHFWNLQIMTFFFLIIFIFKNTFFFFCGVESTHFFFLFSFF